MVGPEKRTLAELFLIEALNQSDFGYLPRLSALDAARVGSPPLDPWGPAGSRTPCLWTTRYHRNTQPKLYSR